MKKIFMPFFMVFLSLFSVSNVNAKVYVSGDIGIFKDINHSGIDGMYSLELGYKFNSKINAEVFYRNLCNHIIGGALRLTPFSIFSLSGGILRQLETNSKNDEIGHFIAPGVNLNWLAGNTVVSELDLFSDLGYYLLT